MSRKPTYKKGEIVEIFSSPIAQMRSEGKAELVEFIDSFGSFERWAVKFKDTGDKQFRRLIKSR